MVKVYKKHEHQPQGFPRTAYQCNKCELWSYKLRDMSKKIDGDCKKCSSKNSVKKIIIKKGD